MVESKAEYEHKKRELFKEIEAKTKKEEKAAEGKDEFEHKKSIMFKETKEKVEEKK